MQINTKVRMNPASFKHSPLFLLIVTCGSTFEYQVCLLEHNWVHNLEHNWVLLKQTSAIIKA